MLHIRNDNSVYISGLRNSSDESYINDAAVTFTVYDDACTQLTGAIGVSMSYVAASNGRYRGVVQSTVDLVDGKEYTIVVTSSNYDFRVEMKQTAAIRRV